MHCFADFSFTVAMVMPVSFGAFHVLVVAVLYLTYIDTHGFVVVLAYCHWLH